MSQSARPARRPAARPGLEVLEPRTLLAATPNVLEARGGGVIFEFAPDGTALRSLAVPYPPGNRSASQDARDLAVAADGRIAVWNGGAANPYLSVYAPASGSWAHVSIPDWNVPAAAVVDGNYSGDLAIAGRYVFVNSVSKDPGSAAPVKGIVRYDLDSGAVDRHFDAPVMSLNVGADGLLYALAYGDNTNVTFHVFDPASMAELRTVTLTGHAKLGNLGAFAVDAQGRFVVGTRQMQLALFGADGQYLDARAYGAAGTSDLDVDPATGVAMFPWVGTSKVYALLVDFALPPTAAPGLVPAAAIGERVWLAYGELSTTPVAQAGGSYTVIEGGSVQLFPFGTSGGVVEWDFDYDGATFDVDAAARNAKFGAGGIDGPATRTIAVRVTDGHGATAIDTAVVTIDNAFPTWTPGLPTTISEGATGVKVQQGAISDYAPADRANLLFDFDLDNDGVYELLGQASPTCDLPDSLFADGPRSVTLKFRVRDDDGGAGLFTKVVTVNNVAPQVTTRTFPATIDEGSIAHIELSGIVEPSAADLASLRFSYDFDGNGTFDVANSTLTGIDVPASLTANGPRSLNVKVRVADKDNAFTDYTLPISVLNVVPILTISGPAVVAAGETYTLQLAATIDPRPEVRGNWVITWGDGTFSSLPSTATSATHVFPAAQSNRTVSAESYDSEGKYYSNTITVMVDVPPRVTSAAFEASSPNNSVQVGPAIRLTFSEPMTGLSAAVLTVVNLTTGQTLPASIWSTAPSSPTLPVSAGLWRTTGALPDGNYRAHLSRDAVRDATGNPLPADVDLDFFVLAGDANRDRVVSFADLVLVAQYYGSGKGPGLKADFDYDGQVGFSDLVIVAQKYDLTLPAIPLPTPPQPSPVTPSATLRKPNAAESAGSLFSITTIKKPATAKPKQPARPARPARR